MTVSMDSARRGLLQTANLQCTVYAAQIASKAQVLLRTYLQEHSETG